MAFLVNVSDLTNFQKTVCYASNCSCKKVLFSMVIDRAASGFGRDLYLGRNFRFEKHLLTDP